MNVPQTPPKAATTRARSMAKGAARLTVREYLPMAAMIGFWAIVALGVGHADTARLLAATVMLRGAMMLPELATAGPMRARRNADAAIRRRSLRNALLMQGGALAVIAAVLTAVTVGLRLADHAMVAQLLWVTSAGLPARAFRLANPSAFPRQLRLHVTGAALFAAAIAWAYGGGPIAMAAAYAAREWIATLTGALFGGGPDVKPRLVNETLRFAEVAKTTVVSSRRLLTYRLTKNILTVFGPFGNFAARTGRGLNVHSKLEQYMPHKRSGFVAFALITGMASVLVAFYSGKPLALIGSAGLAQLSAVAINVLLLWRYLPLRDDPNLVVEEDDDD